jgi:hypothetical protein
MFNAQYCFQEVSTISWPWHANLSYCACRFWKSFFVHDNKLYFITVTVVGIDSTPSTAYSFKTRQLTN